MSFKDQVPAVNYCEKSTVEPCYQLCVREAWDSADPTPESEILRQLNSGSSSAGPLPFYPKLGQVYQDFWNVAKQPTEPCGFLSRFCPKHKPREPSTLKRKAEHGDWGLIPETRKEQRKEGTS